MLKSRSGLARHTVVGVASSALVLVPLGTAVASTAGTEPATAECTVDTLNGPDGTPADVTTGDPTGRYLVTGAGNSQGWLLWDNGKPQRLSDLPQGADVVVLDVNSSGVLIGTNGNQAWKYADGEYTVLPAPADKDVVPTGINATGDVVGRYSDGDAPGGFRPMLWPAAEPDTFQELSAPSGATATGISDTGTIVGNLSDGPAYLWDDPNGAGTPLRDSEGGSLTSAGAISSNGTWVAGAVDTGEGAGAVWNLEDGTLRESPEHYFQGQGFTMVNDSGDATSDYYDAYYAPGIVRPDGSEDHLPHIEGRMVVIETLSNRDAEVTAAGWDDFAGAAVWRGC